MELEGVSRQDESAELLTLKEKLSITLKRTGELETENAEMAASLAESDKKNASELDELSKKSCES